MKGWVKEERNNDPDSEGDRKRWEFVGKLKKSYRHLGNNGGGAIAGANNNYFFLVINLYNNNNNNNNNNNKGGAQGRVGYIFGLPVGAAPPDCCQPEWRAVHAALRRWSPECGIRRLRWLEWKGARGPSTPAVRQASTSTGA